MWGPPEEREREIYVDVNSDNPKVIAKNALWLMARFPGETKQWWGHNSGKYDSLFLVEAIEELKWKCSAHIAGGRIITLKVHGPHGIFKIHDSYAVVQSSIKKAAESWQLQSSKLLNEDDYKTDVRAWSVERLIDGCYADCAIVLELLERVESMFEQEGGRLKATFSSSALSVVKAHAPVLDMRKLKHVNIVARKAFAGGRVEVFNHTPKYALTEWDINSSYPHSMAQPLPYQYLGTVSADKAMRAYGDTTKAGVVEATVNVPKTYLPVLPWRHPVNKGIFFPIGIWRGFFDADELRYAEATGTKIDALHSMLVYSKEQQFDKFIQSFYSLKAKAQPNSAAREFYKLCLNGCYGKFAQKPEVEELVIYPTQEEAITEALEPKNKGKFRFISARSCRYVAVSGERWPAQTHYALAGAITAHSRIRLHEYLSEAIQPAYTDTDSIHASRRSSMAGFENSLLGGLKIELDDYSGVFAAPKIYGLYSNDSSTKVFKSKGFPVSEEIFKRILKGDDHEGPTFEGDAMESTAAEIHTFRMQLAKRQVTGDNTVRRNLQKRSWKGLSTKRRPIYDSDGGTVPWSVNELQQDKHLDAVSPLAQWLWRK